MHVNAFQLQYIDLQSICFYPDDDIWITARIGTWTDENIDKIISFCGFFIDNSFELWQPS
jgi:hypothetical protein